MMAATSVEEAHKKTLTSRNFISEVDVIWPDEESEPEVEKDADGKKKKAKKKAAKWEMKMYPKHKYDYPAIGKFQKKDKEIHSISNDPDRVTLSYFERKNNTSFTTEFHANHEERKAARDNIAEKKAKLRQILTGIKPPEKEGEAAQGENGGNKDIQNVGVDANGGTAKKKEEGEEASDSSQAEFDAESEEVPDEESPVREKQLFWAQKNGSRKYDHQFDTMYNLEEQMQEYKEIKKIFKENHIELADEKKNPINLKNAIFMQSGLDALDPDVVKTMRTKANRYPNRAEQLMEDPFAWDAPKPAKGKKK